MPSARCTTRPVGDLIGYAPPNLNERGLLQPADVRGLRWQLPDQSPRRGSCGSPTKYIAEGMIGFQYRPVSSTQYGKLQYSVTYQIINRQLWAGLGSATTPLARGHRTA